MMNYHFLNTILEYNNNCDKEFIVAPSKLNPLKLKKYFYSKAVLSNDLNEASYALMGLKLVVESSPFIVKTANLSKFRFVDHNGNEIRMTDKKGNKFVLVSATSGLNMH